MFRLSTRSALAGLAVAGVLSAPAQATLNYFWEFNAAGSNVVGTLNLITDLDSFTAQLLAETSNGTTFRNVSGDLMPTAGNTTYFSGGYALGDPDFTDPILAGTASFPLGGGSLSAGISGGVVNQSWISNWPQNSFPTGTAASPVILGQFVLPNTATGVYEVRVGNADLDQVVMVLNGTISNGRFSQRLAGDANLDGDVDVFQPGGQGDIQIVLDNLGTGSTLRTGDMNGDDDVDVFQPGGQGDIQIVLDNLGNTTQTRGAVVGGSATATYDNTTGELTFDILGNVQLVGVGSIGNFDTSVTPDNLSFAGGAVVVPPAQFDEDTISYFFGANLALDQGQFSVGPVLVPGLTAGDISFEFSPVGGQTTAGTVIIVPEPGSLALLALGGLALTRRRRAA